MVITQPVIHNRFIVKQHFESMKQNGTKYQTLNMPEELTIATCRNEGKMTDRLIDSLQGYDEVSFLESSLQFLGINSLEVLTDARLPWRNTFKFQMLHDYLNSGKCNTEYFMCCDAIDVIFQDDPQKVIDIFETFDCDMLFMSTNSIDGYNCMSEVFDEVKQINGDNNRYLNSGVYIGRTEFVKEVIAEAMKYAVPHGVTMDDYREYLNSNPKDYPKGSQDQDIFRYIEPKFYPRLKVDYENIMAYR